MHISNNSYLPGDKPHEKIIDEIVRVDHSGEFGAQKIYQGQIWDECICFSFRGNFKDR